VRYGAGRTMLGQRIAHSVLTRMEEAGESPDDRVQNAVARSQPVRKAVDQSWPAVDPAKLLHALFSSPERLAEAADGILGAEEQELLLWAKPPRSAGAARWTAADVVLLDELADLLERTTSLAHVVVDEAQDLSAMQLRAVARRCTTGSVTVLGDIAQATTPWATGSWAIALGHLGKSDAHIEELTQGFRVPREIIEYAARLLPSIAPELAPPTSVRQQTGGLEVIALADEARSRAPTSRDHPQGAGRRGLHRPDRRGRGGGPDREVLAHGRDRADPPRRRGIRGIANPWTKTRPA
jgi:DNA helicase IV